MAPFLYDKEYDSAGYNPVEHGFAGRDSAECDFVGYDLSEHDSVPSLEHNEAPRRQSPPLVFSVYPVYFDYWHSRVVLRISLEPQSSTWHSRANTSASTRINEKS